MASATPRRSLRTSSPHTPKMSERKKALFQADNCSVKESLTKHRRLPVLDSDTDSEDCDLGIISALGSSSGDEHSDHDLQKTPENVYETRSLTSKLLKQNQNLKNFMKSPFTLKKYQTLNVAKGTSPSTPATPHMDNHPGTPSSTHSCTSSYTTTSEHSRARKNLASLIADTESCSSSLKDLNFDTDSGTDTKENTPTKSLRKSTRNRKYTPKFASFKGILQEQKRNTSPLMTLDSQTDFNDSPTISPTHMLKTPQNQTESMISPPKIRRSVVEIAESPEDCCESEMSYKRLRNDSITSDGAPQSKYLKLDPTSAPKARLSLFNSDRLKEILSVKSFYGKSNLDAQKPAPNIISKIGSAVIATTTHPRRYIHRTSHRRSKRKPGQINMGVHHKIRKPKIHKGPMKIGGSSMVKSAPVLNTSTQSNQSLNNTFVSKNSSQNDTDLDNTDIFSSENKTIADLLSQWTEEDLPEKELCHINKAKTTELACFNKSVMEETNSLFTPISAVPVNCDNVEMTEGAVIIELGGNQPEISNSAEVMPVGKYLVLDQNTTQAEEIVPDLDEIERELQMLDEQILKMANSNNIDAEAVIASTEISSLDTPSEKGDGAAQSTKLFSIFSAPATGLDAGKPKAITKKMAKKSILKSVSNQYVIDAGQKKFGATQCTACGVIYEIGDPQDEYDHSIYHNATHVLRFNGWKEERIVGRWDMARCICVRGTDPGWKRVSALLTQLVHPQLGYHDDLPHPHYVYTGYLYIDKKEIVGCLVVEPKAKANKLIPGDPDCCSDEEYTVKCGVSRIWTHANVRRRGIAEKMLECARASFLHGVAITRSDIAFSAPTAAGKGLATKYCGTEQFYMYLT